MSVPGFALSQHATQDLDDIWEHIAQNSVDAADRVIDKLHEQIKLIAAILESDTAAWTLRSIVRFCSGQPRTM